MNELIPVSKAQVNGELIDTVSARDLHEFLKVKRQFGNWINDRIKRFGLNEKSDYIQTAHN